MLINLSQYTRHADTTEIRAKVTSLVECAASDIIQGSWDSLEELEEKLQDYAYNICPYNVEGGTMHDERMNLVYHYEDEHGDIYLDCKMDEINNVITQYALQGLSSLFLSAIRGLFTDKIESFMDENDLTLEDRTCYNFGDWRHYRETDVEDGTVFHYRNIEGEQIHVDIYTLYLKGSEIHFRKNVDKSEVTQAENVFCAI